MNNEFIEARELIVKAREALRRGDRASARQLGERAAHLAPKMEDVWLILAASDPNPKDALTYARKAMELNPRGTRARQAVEWTSTRLKQAQGSTEPSLVSPKITLPQAEAAASLPKKRAYQTAVAMPQLNASGRNWLLPALLTGAAFMLFGFIALFLLTSPTVASIADNIRAAAPTQENLWAPVDIAKPAAAPINGNAFVPSSANESSALDDSQLEELLSADPTPTLEPTTVPNNTPATTETPGTMAMEILADTPTSEYIAPTPSSPKDQVANSGNKGRWIDVNLSEQMVYVYEGDVLVNSFVVSTGVAGTPTVTGKYKIYVKVRVQDMRGPGYHLKDVPYVMFFYGDYGLHGTYWHNNFGTPMSRGCVNLTIDDAAWLYNWASVGTVVNVHY
jgi:lipoprotein-anchoring transpeptidase ErfK/SrfK